MLHSEGKQRIRCRTIEKIGSTHRVSLSVDLSKLLWRSSSRCKLRHALSKKICRHQVLGFDKIEKIILTPKYDRAGRAKAGHKGTASEALGCRITRVKAGKGDAKGQGSKARLSNKCACMFLLFNFAHSP